MNQGAITHLASACQSVSEVRICCVITVLCWIKHTPWKNHCPSSASHTHTHNTAMMMSIYISSSPLVLLHNHTSVTMVGSTHRFERAVQIGWVLLRQSQPLAYHGMFWLAAPIPSAASLCWQFTGCKQALHSCYTGSVQLLLLCALKQAQGVSVNVPFFSSSFLHTTRSCAFSGIAEACLEVGFSLTALIGWCGRLSVHESSLSVYGRTLRPGAFWWWLATQLLTLWSHVQSRNSSSHDVCIAALWIFSTEHRRFSKNCCISWKS